MCGASEPAQLIRASGMTHIPTPTMNRMNSMTSDNLPVSKAPKQVQNWQKSLLDLSLRNPLINRTSRHAVELCVPPALIGEFEDLVNDKEYITLAAGRHRPAESSDDSLQQEQVRAESLLKERTVEVELAATERVQRLQALATSARTAVGGDRRQ